MLNFFSYSFIQHALIGGIIVAIIAPIIGSFLIMKRYALIADTLAHTSLMGVALGLVTGINPLITALGVSISSSFMVEKLRASQKIPGDAALSIFLSGSLAIAIILISLSHKVGITLYSYLFGSILTISTQDIYILTVIAIVSLCVIRYFYRDLIFSSFDEEAAAVAGYKTKKINLILICLSASLIVMAIPIVGVLLISALTIIPTLSAFMVSKSFKKAQMLGVLFSVIAVVVGIAGTFYLNIPASGLIVLVLLLEFVVCWVVKK